MAKHGFKVGGTGKQVFVVRESSVDADTVSAVMVGDAPTVESDAEVVSVRPVLPTSEEAALAGATVLEAPVLTAEGWTIIGAGTDQASVADTGSGGDALYCHPGTLIVDARGDVDAILPCEPDVTNVLQALRADDDGMGAMQAIEVSASLTATVLDVVASEPVVSPFAALVAQYRPIVADCVVRVDLPAMLAVDARAMAQRVADLTGFAVSVIGPAGVESIVPKRSVPRSASVARGTVVHSGDATTAKEEGTLARCSRGEWLDSDVPESNATILTLKHALQTAHGALDLDMLLTLDRKTVSTYYNHARAYRTWAIGDVTRQLAEREAAAKANAERIAAIEASWFVDAKLAAD